MTRFLRLGETEWAKLGKFTGTTDIELTPVGRQQIRSAATMLVGAGKFLDTCRISHIFVSPRRRARQTFELLLPPPVELGWMVEFTESIAEWDYGEYEGRTAGEIKELRKEKGLDQEREWSIWRDGCEGGEYDIFCICAFSGLDRLLLIPGAFFPLITGQCSKLLSVWTSLFREFERSRDLT